MIKTGDSVPAPTIRKDHVIGQMTRMRKYNKDKFAIVEFDVDSDNKVIPSSVISAPCHRADRTFTTRGSDECPLIKNWSFDYMLAFRCVGVVTGSAEYGIAIGYLSKREAIKLAGAISKAASDCEDNWDGWSRVIYERLPFRVVITTSGNVRILFYTKTGKLWIFETLTLSKAYAMAAKLVEQGMMDK